MLPIFRLREFEQVNRSAAARMTPRLLGSESEDRREQSAKRVESLVHNALRGAAARRIGRVAIHPVFRDVDVQTAQIDGAKLVECMINLVKLERFVGGLTITNHSIEPLQNPAIN